MIKKISLAVVVVLVAFVAFVATRKGDFHFERSGVINASADKIYPYLSDFKKCQLWNPYDQKDPNMKRTYTGTEGAVGSAMEFEGNRESGSGKLEIVKLVPNESVDLKLTMTSPMKAENMVRYQLTTEGAGTRFTWSMEGNRGFMGKLFSVFVDCDKMLAGDFDKGIAQLKSLVEQSSTAQR